MEHCLFLFNKVKIHEHYCVFCIISRLFSVLSVEHCLFLFNKVKIHEHYCVFCIISRFRLSQIIPHSDYLNIMPKIGLQRGRGRHQKINFFKDWSSFNCSEIFLKSFVSKILAICLIFRLKM